MTELSHGAKTLVAASRHGYSMRGCDKARVRQKLTRRIGSGMALSSAIAISTTVAQAAPTTLYANVLTWLPLTAKFLTAAAISCTATLGIMHVARTSTWSLDTSNPVRTGMPLESWKSATQAVSHAPAEGSVEQAAPLAPRPTPAVRASSQPPASTEPVPPLAVRAPQTPPVSHAVPAAAGPNAKAKQGNSSGLAQSVVVLPSANVAQTNESLANQISAIRESRAAIRRGDPETALAVLDRVLSREGGGPLEQEALSVRISALCQKGDVTTARQVAERFTLRFPSSPLLSSIRSSCALNLTQ